VEGTRVHGCHKLAAWFTLPLPRKLIGKTLAQSGIGARTGLLVLAINYEGDVITNPSAETSLHADSELVMIGDAAQIAAFDKLYVRN
jgi:voltage-gated potassium channel